jgi:hypothetical protein
MIAIYTSRPSTQIANSLGSDRSIFCLTFIVIPNPVLIPSKPALTPNPSPKKRERGAGGSFKGKVESRFW